MGSVFGPCFVIQNLCPSSFAVILMGEGKASLFVLTVLLMSYDSQCSVALPHDAVG